jgi:hypothetical protein
VPFTDRYAIASTYVPFRQVGAGFNPPFGRSINHSHVLGLRPTWEMHLGEYPTLLLFGCGPPWHEWFAQVYVSIGNIHALLAPSLAQKREGPPGLQEQMAHACR